MTTEGRTKMSKTRGRSGAADADTPTESEQTAAGPTTNRSARSAGKNSSLVAAKALKNDEFYTQWADIEREMNAYLEFDPDAFRDKVVLLPCDDPEWSNFAKFFALHFTEYGIKRLISTSFAPDKKPAISYQPTLFESEAPQYDPTLTRSRGKMFVLDSEDINGDGIVNIDDLRWSYLEGDGDFRSDEVTALRDEADIVVTNPPFSLFREFIAWLVQGDVRFSVIGPSSATTYVEIFPLIKANKLWKGRGFHAGNAFFATPTATDSYAAGVYDPSTGLVKFRNVSWFTNLDHGRRHEPLQLMSMADNIKFSTHKNVRGVGYQRYYNFQEAIEVPFIDAIPSDFDGPMGVPITFLDKYNPKQFEIIAHADDMEAMREIGVQVLGEDFVREYYERGGTGGNSPGHRRLGLTEPKYYTAYKRIIIRRKEPS